MRITRNVFLLSTVIFISAAFSARAVGAQESGRTSSRFSSLNNVDKAGQVGAGLQIGSLSGVNIEYWLTSVTALNATIAGDEGNTDLSLAHLWFFKDAMHGPFHDTPTANYFVPYVGVGALMSWGDHSDFFDRNREKYAVGAQVPLGIEFLPHAQRYSIYGEIAPTVEVSPVGHGFLTADLGAKFYF